MNILNRRTFIVAYYRVGNNYHVKHYTASFFKAYSAIVFHSILNWFSKDRICCRIIGSYVR